MRFFILTAAVCLVAWSSPEIRAWSSSLLADPVDPHALAAIELRCATEMDAFRDDCARELQRDFELGVREAETIVRRHCTQFSSDWAPATRAPLPICEEIYGGWIKG